MSWQDKAAANPVFFPVDETQSKRWGKRRHSYIHAPPWKGGLLEAAAQAQSLFCKAKPKHKVPEGEVPLLLQSQDLRAAVTLSEEPNLNLCACE